MVGLSGSLFPSQLLFADIEIIDQFSSLFGKDP